ncbi:MAG: hypothetical protein FWE27_09625 [Defluviitaleaceae bacterium]|nr:hypothetical protein [Defluviitaleaceae bacterium]
MNLLFKNPVNSGFFTTLFMDNVQWDDFGVQIFQYAGDVTLIGMPDTLSQMPELHEDTFDHRLRTGEWQDAGGRELLYIYHHELPKSKLWNLLMNL